jgi:hypothetical protein
MRIHVLVRVGGEHWHRIRIFSSTGLNIPRTRSLPYTRPQTRPRTHARGGRHVCSGARYGGFRAGAGSAAGFFFQPPRFFLKPGGNASHESSDSPQVYLLCRRLLSVSCRMPMSSVLLLARSERTELTALRYFCFLDISVSIALLSPCCLSCSNHGHPNCHLRVRRHSYCRSLLLHQGAEIIYSFFPFSSSIPLFDGD